MKKIKKLLMIFMTLLLGISLASCGDTNEANPDTGGNDNENGGNNSDNDNDEFTLPLEDGFNQITFYWDGAADISKCDVWAWWAGKEGSGYLMHECSYGGKSIINVPETIEEVGFIVRKDCDKPGENSWGNATKDFGEDRFATITGRETKIWLKTGQEQQYTSNDNGVTLEQIKLFKLAGMIDANQIEYSVTPKTKLTSLDDVVVRENGNPIKVEAISSLNNEVISGKITVKEKMDVSKNYTLEIKGYGEKPVVPTKIFDSESFKNNYIYDGDDLGANVNGDKTDFKVWAPTASKVVLNLYAEGKGGEATSYEMTRGQKGVYSYTANCGHGTYYTYTVTTSVGTQETQDPYSRSAGVNGDRSMVVDYALTNPEGFTNETYVKHRDGYTVDSYSDAVVWETHVRDFSNKIKDSKYKGKFLAFTETGLKNSSGQKVGVDYLVDLGVTHVHLMPSYDYATVNEENPDEQFNWGYDPKNYNVPEGSYSTNPYDGSVRVKEFKQMVQALHAQGIGVVMDVVYNHTFDANSSFNKIVPYYYYRYTATGANSSASGCGNDTASERPMYRKFMIESLTQWAKEYKVDGFRFDLMGLHDLETMQQIETAIHTINPKALIYGEGWTMGWTIDGSAQANQGNIKRIKPVQGSIGGIAVFNDVMRDGLKGNNFSKTGSGYISGATGEVLNVAFGMMGGSTRCGKGGWTTRSGEVVNYMSAHDNFTLWDKLESSKPNASVEERVAMNKFGAEILFHSKGMVFMQAGEEMMRTKGGDENSYKSPDSVNNIDWEKLKAGSHELELSQFYASLIKERKANKDLYAKQTSFGYKKLEGNALEISIRVQGVITAYIIVNPTKTVLNYNLGAGNYETLYGSAINGNKVSLNSLGVGLYRKIK